MKVNVMMTREKFTVITKSGKNISTLKLISVRILLLQRLAISSRSISYIMHIICNHIFKFVSFLGIIKHYLLTINF